MSQHNAWPNAWRLVLRFTCLFLCLFLALTFSPATAQDNTMSSESAEVLIQQLQAQNANLQGRLDRMEASRDRLRAQVGELEGAAMSATAGTADASASADATAQLTRTQSAYDRLKQQMTTLQTNNADLEARIDRELASKARIQAQLSSLQESAAALETEAEDATAELTSLKLQRQDRVREILNLKKQVSEATMQAAESGDAASQLRIAEGERDAAIGRIASLRDSFGEQQAASAASLERAVRLGDRARAQRNAALEKLKAMSMTDVDDSSDSSETPASENPSVEDSQSGAAESLNLYRTLSARLSAGETLSAEEQSQYDNALEALRANQQLVAQQIGGSTYTVVDGDTLSSIAQNQYGDANEYLKILDANNYLIDDADLIFPGFELVIPQ